MSISISSSPYSSTLPLGVVAVVVVVVTISAVRPSRPDHARPPPLRGLVCNINNVGSVYPDRYVISIISPNPCPIVLEVVVVTEDSTPVDSKLPLLSRLSFSVLVLDADDDVVVVIVSSRILADNVDNGNMYGSDATLHQDDFLDVTLEQFSSVV